MYVTVSPHDGLSRLFSAKSLWANNICANRLNDDAMEKTSTMKQAGTSVLVALALICVVSCAKSTTNRPPSHRNSPLGLLCSCRRAVMKRPFPLPGRASPLSTGARPARPQPVRSAANAANASLPRPRAAAPGATL